jgi:DNA-binding Lrp family transcriptional regulator
MQNYVLDNTDIEILRILIRDCRTPYRSIGVSIGMSTNAIKTRVARLVSQGIIQRFMTFIDHAIFGYSKVCYLTIRDIRTVEKALNRLKLLGEVVLEVNCIGGISLVGIAIRKEEEEKIQLLVEALKPALIQNMVMGHSNPVRLNLLHTDFKIIKCLISDARMEISEIAKRVLVTPKTVSSRLAKMQENRILNFIVTTNPLNMKGYIRFGLIIRLDRRRRDDYQKSIKRIQEELETRFVIVVPINFQEDVTNFQLFARRIFEIDPALKKIESLNGVRGADVFIPYSGKVHQDWILREIDNRLNTTEVVSSAPHVLTF